MKNIQKLFMPLLCVVYISLSFQIVLAQIIVQDPWSVNITVTLDGVDKHVCFGTKNGGTDGYDSAQIDKLAPPPTPEEFYIYFAIDGIQNVTDNLAHDFRSVSKSPNDWSLHIIQTSGENGIISWDASDFPEGTHSSGSLSINGTDMLTEGRIEFTADTALTIHYIAPEHEDPIPSPIEYLTAIQFGNDLLLKWSPIKTNTLGDTIVIDHYSIYRGTDPNFLPNDSNLLVEVSDTSYIDLDVIGNPNINHFYIVLSVDENGTKSDKSNCVGEFYNSFSCPLTIEVDGVEKHVYFGTKVGASDVYDGPPIDTLAPPPPTENFYAYFNVEGTPHLTDKLSYDYRSTDDSTNVWSLNIIQTSGVDVTISWDKTDFPVVNYSQGSVTINNTNMLDFSSTVESLSRLLSH